MNLGKTMVGRHVANQLLRSGTSVGSNFEEACGAQSRADFIHKLQIVLKEFRETTYWLRLIEKSGILKEYGLNGLLNETKELSNTIAKSIITAKRGR
jgi:four helix bundle protein